MVLETLDTKCPTFSTPGKATFSHHYLLSYEEVFLQLPSSTSVVLKCFSAKKFMIKTTSSPVYKIRLCLSLSLLFANTNKLFSHFQIITRENKSLLLFHLRDRISHPSLRSIPIYSSHRFYFFVEIRGFICSILLHARGLCPRLQSCPHFSRFYLLLIPAAARAVRPRRFRLFTFLVIIVVRVCGTMGTDR